MTTSAIPKPHIGASRATARVILAVSAASLIILLNKWVALLFVSALLTVLIYLLVVFGWWSANTKVLRYFGRPVSERRAFKARVRSYGQFVQPVLDCGLGALLRPEWMDLKHDGLRFPKSACTRGSVSAALSFTPSAGDIFVATQMKCGTTWMQQIVYEVLSHGRGDLGDTGHVHLNAMSPWLESARGVPIATAPRIGDRGARIIKTHLPASHCPYSPAARYIYVTRHPVSCLLSSDEFTRMNGGALARQGTAVIDWFCSDAMWWGSWPDHVAGWWRWATDRPNVLFLHYEDMKDDLPTAIREVAGFLGIILDDDELAVIAHKSSYDYMKAREPWFEMSPPTIFAVGSSLFKSGSATRNAAAAPDIERRVMDFCRARLAGTSYPVDRYQLGDAG